MITEEQEAFSYSEPGIYHGDRGTKPNKISTQVMSESDTCSYFGQFWGKRYNTKL